MKAGILTGVKNPEKMKNSMRFKQKITGSHCKKILNSFSYEARINELARRYEYIPSKNPTTLIKKATANV